MIEPQSCSHKDNNAIAILSDGRMFLSNLVKKFPSGVFIIKFPSKPLLACVPRKECRIQKIQCTECFGKANFHKVIRTYEQYVGIKNLTEEKVN
ncbi:MAG: hypothetical protein V4487_06375 [Chlamydiota bacterium]